jgi:hypothetical protein
MLSRTFHFITIAFAITTISVPANAQSWSDLAKGALKEATKQVTGDSNSSSAVMGLSTEDISAGLKEALRVGSEKVVEQVGRSDGYLGDPAIHIPLPDTLRTVHETLDKFGFGSLTQNVETRINRAAEKAAPEAKEVFWQSIQAMRLDDAKKILDGPKDAATQYFQRNMSAPLTERFTPIVESSLAEVGAIQAFDQMISQYKSVPFVPDVKTDLTAYAVTKALDGLFHYMAAEEAAIRANPAARTTDILKKVFASR